MSLADTCAVYRRRATPGGGPEPDVHLLVTLGPGLWVGFVCDPSGVDGVRAPVFCRTTDPNLATCPGCVAAGQDN